MCLRTGSRVIYGHDGLRWVHTRAWFEAVDDAVVDRPDAESLLDHDVVVGTEDACYCCAATGLQVEGGDCANSTHSDQEDVCFGVHFDGVLAFYELR